MESAFAERYAALQRTHWWFRGRRRILDAVLDRELGAAPRRILAVGCGPAEGLAWLARRGEIVGLDVEPAFGEGAPRGGFLRASANALPFAENSFDAILAFDVLEHLDDDAGALREIARVARPGASLVLTVPAMPSLWGAHDVVNRHRRRYTRTSLAATFERAGVRVSSIAWFNTLLLPAIALVRWSRRLRPRSPVARSDFEIAAPRAGGALLEGVLGFERHWVGRVPVPRGVSLVAIARL